MSSFKRKAILTGCVSLAISCAGSKKPHFNTVPSHARRIGILATGEQKEIWTPKLKEILTDLYSCQVVELELPASGARPSSDIPQLDPPSNVLRDAGVKKLDNILSTHSSSTGTTAQFYDLNKMVNSFDVQIPVNQKDPEIFLAGELSRRIPNPDRLPPGDRKKIAAELERRGESKMARDVLVKVRDEYKTMFIHDIGDRQALEQKLEGLQRVVDQRACYRADAAATFDLKLENHGIAEEYFQNFARSIAEINFRQTLNKFTTKPVLLTLNFDSNTNQGDLRLRLRFSPKWYAPQLARYPRKIGNHRVISFRPYFDLMRGLARLRTTFARSLPSQVSETVQQFNLVLTLTKPCEQTLEFAVGVGSQGNVLDPYFLSVHVDGYDETSLEGGDKQIFNETGMFALGPKKLLSGERTTYGILYDFLEIQE